MSKQYKVIQKPDNTTVVFESSVDNSLTPDQVVSSLPAGAVLSRKGSRWLTPYAPEADGKFAPNQFGLDKYYAPNFKFLIDWDGWHSPNERRRYGINMFADWSVKVSERDQIQPGEGFLFITENFLTDQAFGHKFAMESLQEFLNQAWDKVPAIGYGYWANFKYVTYNLENPLYLTPGNKGTGALPGWDGEGYYGQPGYPDWNSVKNNSIVLENTPETVTLAQLATNPTKWRDEYVVRLTNRINLLIEIIRRKSAPSTRISSGCMMYWSSYPNPSRVNDSDLLVDGNGKVSNIGGSSNGNITLQIPNGGGPWTVNLANTVNDHEDWVNQARGRHGLEFSEADYNSIFIAKNSGATSLADIWAKEVPQHIVGEEMGLIEMELQRQSARLQTHVATKGLFREHQFWPENTAYTNPLPQLQNIPGGFSPAPQTWWPPYHLASRYIVTRFRAGDAADWGFHLFVPGNPNFTIRDPATDPDPNYRAYHNHSQHTVSALYQARADMQPYEKFYPGSTFVDKPEVQISQSGGWSAYTAVDAWANTKPAYKLRYKPVPGGTRVLILGGFKQGWTSEHIDNVRVPNGGLGGNIFKVKLRGPAAQVYEFFVKSGDTGQTYEALPTAVTQWEKPGYYGRIGVATTTTPTTPTDPTVPTTPTPTGGYNRVMFVGNSITHHPPIQDWAGGTRDWGMDASTKAQDYKSIVTARLKISNPNIDAREFKDFPGTPAAGGINLQEIDGSRWEADYWKLNNNDVFPGGLTRYKAVQDWKPDLLIMRIAENVQDPSHDFANYYKGFIDYLTAQNPTCQVILTTSVWEPLGGAQVATSAIIRTVGSERNYPVADLNNTPGGTSGYANHPNDQGMLGIADKITAKIPNYIPPTTPTVPHGDWLPYTDQSIGNIMVLENSTVRFEFNRLLGAVIASIFDKTQDPNQNLVSTPNYTGELDGGQSVNWAQYLTPHYEYHVNGFTFNGNYYPPQTISGNTSTGFNPVQGGSITLGRSIVYKWAKINTSDRGDVVCIQVRGLLWNPHYVPGNVLMNMEFWLGSPRTISWRVQENVEERNPAIFPEERTFVNLVPHERPTIYPIGELNRPMYRRNGGDVDLNSAVSEHYPDDHACGNYNSGLTKGLTLYMPDADAFYSYYIGAPFGINKLDSRQRLNLDIPGSYESRGHLIVGGRSQALATIAALGPINTTLDFDFVGDNHDWYNSRGPMKRVNGYLVFDIGVGNTDQGVTTYDGSVKSPYRRWDASVIATIQATFALSSNVSQLKFTWAKRDGSGNVQSYNKTFPVTADGQFRDYLISTSDPNWSGTIIQIGIEAVSGISPNSKLTLKRIRKAESTTSPPTTPTPITTPTGWIEYSNQDPFNNDLATLDNGTVRATFRKSIGGGLWYLGKSGTDDEQSIVQVNMQGDHWDKGRGLGWAGYGSPFANELFCIDGVCTGTNPPPNRGGIGNNPCMGGSINPGDASQVIKSAMIDTQDRGRVFCIQVRPKQWDFLNKPSHYLLNMEYWFTHANTMGYRLQIITEPRPSGVTPASNYSGWTQEEITMYVASKYRRRVIRINGQDTDLFDSENSVQESRMSEKGIGTYNADLSYGLTIWTPDCVAMKSSHGDGVFGDPNGVNGPRANSYGFMQSRPERNLDNPGSYTYQSYLIVDSRAEALTRIATLPPINTAFDFDFTSPANQQHGWSNSQCRMIAENGELALYIGDGHTDQGVTSYRGAIYSPHRAWNATDLGTLILRAKVPVGVNQLQLKFFKHKTDGRLEEFTKLFSVTGDNVERDYTISTADQNFNGTINRIGIQATDSVPNGAKLILKRIRKN